MSVQNGEKVPFNDGIDRNEVEVCIKNVIAALHPEGRKKATALLQSSVGLKHPRTI